MNTHLGHVLYYRQLGEAWTVGNDVLAKLETFTCLTYGQVREQSVNKVRLVMLKKMVGEDDTINAKSKVDFVRLPPCQNALIPHIQRVNYRVACYKRAHEANFLHPKPYDDGQGWQKSGEGTVEPLWSTGPILPAELVDLVERTVAENEAHVDEDEDIEIDFDEWLADEEEEL